ncbi:MAG: hypothetical protein RBU21_03410 [FCB group bacterium]|nr:hypothetical protein [FCB group bacterium]
MSVAHAFKANTQCSLILLTALPCTADSPYAPGPGLYPRFDAKQAQPGVEYGTLPDLPLPKTILYSVSPDELLADAEAWTQAGFGAFFITGVAPEWSSNVWAADNEPWTIGQSDATLQKVKQATAKCTQLGADTFLTMSFSHFFDWFDDAAWPQIENNFRQFAIFARESGCTGLAIDVEYIWPQYHFNWDGYSYDGYTRKDVVDTIRKRFTKVAEVMYDEFPQMVLMTFPEELTTLGSHVQTAWIEVAAKRNAPGGIHLCLEYTYRRPNIRYVFGQTWMNNHLIQTMLSEPAKAYWIERCSIAAGLWPFGADAEDYHGTEPTPEEFRQAFAASLMSGSKYNWIYSHNAREFMLGRESKEYTDTARRDAFRNTLAKRDVVTSSPYPEVAKALRTLQPRDYSKELGVTIVTTLAGPREEVEVNLMPTNIYAGTTVEVLNAQLWDLGMRIFQGEDVNLSEALHTQTQWLLAGPFENSNEQGFANAYPPELNPTSPGIAWQPCAAPNNGVSINLASIFKPSEDVCAYALCYAVSDAPRDVLLRVGANDLWKLWVGGKLVGENDKGGRAILDRDVVPATLPAGTTPILLKVCNNKKDWGFILRITDNNGNPVQGLTLRTQP